MKKLWMIAACAALLATACSKEDSSDFGEQLPITIDATILQSNETNTRATDLDFEKDDAIGVTITKTQDQVAVAENARFTFDGKLFNSDDQLLWYQDIGLESEVVAYYPYASALPTEFSVQTDQTGANYTKSDLMRASKTAKPTLNPTSLTFKHMLTKLAVTLTNKCGGDIKSVTFRGMKPTATVDLAQGTVAVKAEASATEIKATEVEAGTKYAAIVVPQDALIEMVVKVDFGVNGGGVKALSQTYKQVDLQNGQYSVGLEVLPEEIKISMTGEIEDWTDNGALTPEGGVQPAEPSFEEHEGYFIYDGVRYNTLKMADGRTWMTENLIYLPEGVTPTDDPADNNARVFYPYKVEGGQAVVLKDEASIKKYGYLYRMDQILNVKELTPENAKTLNGAKGICPKGWHVPSHKDWVDLIGGSNADMSVSPKVEMANPNAPFYRQDYEGAHITELNAANFNLTFSGYRQRTNNLSTTIGKYNTVLKKDDPTVIAVTYYGCSTMYKVDYNEKDKPESGVKNIQYWGPMTNFAPNYIQDGKLALLYNHYQNGVAVRCIKDQQ